MTTSSSGAVFFLGTRAHYQVLQQPDRYDVENGNTSAESTYQNSWGEAEMDSSGNFIGERNMGYIDNETTNVTEEKEKEIGNGVKRRGKRRQSETTTLCERDIEMKPALLNNVNGSETPKSKPSRGRVNILTFLASLARRKRTLKDTDQIQYLQHIESALTSCTYRESCRCLECQSRYFECDESDYSSDESDYGAGGDYTDYVAGYTQDYQEPPPQRVDEDDVDDEVFIDTAPGDTTSTDMLLEARGPQNSTSSAGDVTSHSDVTGAREPAMEIEVAAGTPVLLNYLLTHPITCNIQ